MKRVLISIYDDETGDEVETDEPLYNDEEEIGNQAYRTQRKFFNTLLKDKPLDL